MGPFRGCKAKGGRNVRVISIVIGGGTGGATLIGGEAGGRVAGAVRPALPPKALRIAAACAAVMTPVSAQSAMPASDRAQPSSDDSNPNASVLDAGLLSSAANKLLLFPEYCIGSIRPHRACAVEYSRFRT